MFYCDKCADINVWPKSLTSSTGVCEVCGECDDCNDIKSTLLPERKKKTVNKSSNPKTRIMKMDFVQAQQICNQALPLSVYKKMNDKEILNSANCIVLFASGMIQRIGRADYEMSVNIKYKPKK